MFAQSASVDFYAALDISRTATTQEINAAYKRLALKYHPDKCGECFLEKFRQITEAAEVLRDPQRRFDHDRVIGHDSRGSKNNNRRQPRRYQREDDWRNWTAAKRPWRNNDFNFNLKSPEDCYMYSYGSSVHMDPNSAESKAESDRISAEAQQWAEEYATLQAEWAAETTAEANTEHADSKEADEFDPWSNDTEEKGPETNQATGLKMEAQHAAFEEADEFDPWSNDGQAFTLSDFGAPSNYAREFSTEIKQPTEADRAAKWKMPGQFSSSQFDPIQNTNPGFPELDENGLLSFEFPWKYPSSQSHTSTHYSGHDPRSGHGFPLQTDKNGFSDCKVLPDEHYDCTEHFLPGPSINRKPSTKKASPMDLENFHELVTAEGPLAPFCPYFNAKLADGSGRYNLEDMATEVNGIIGQIMFEWVFVLKQESGVTAPPVTNSNCSHHCEWIKEFGLPECTVCRFWQPIYMMTCSTCGIKRCICCRF